MMTHWTANERMNKTCSHELAARTLVLQALRRNAKGKIKEQSSERYRLKDITVTRNNRIVKGIRTNSTEHVHTHTWANDRKNKPYGSSKTNKSARDYHHLARSVR